jgi:hypothetical protein
MTNLNLDVVDLLAFRWRETQQGGVIRNREDREYAQLYAKSISESSGTLASWLRYMATVSSSPRM